MESMDARIEKYPSLEVSQNQLLPSLPPPPHSMPSSSSLSSSHPSPHSSLDKSPLPGTPPDPGSSAAVSPSAHDHDGDDAASEPISEPAGRRRSTSSTKSSGDREKRKRSRVTPDQLIHLERFFSVDRSPTAARRREISQMLGMQERQTQIWFQNRRAKAKLLDGKNKSHLPTSPPETPPELQPGFQAELHSLIHEDEAVTVIPCTDLTIGTWRRMATTVGKHDLVAYLCDAKRCLTWFIHSAGHGFKMEIAYDSVVSTEFANAAPGAGLATFILARPPAFFLEAPAGTSSPQGDRCALPGTRVWKRCADWTEGMQATKVLRHELVGSAVQLAHVLASFHAGKASGEVRLHDPAYTAAPASSSNPTSPPSLPLPSSLPPPPQQQQQQQQQQQHLDLDLSPALAGGLSALPTYYTQAQDVFEPSHVPRRSFSGTPLLLAPNPPDYPAAAASPSLQPSSSSSSGHPSPYMHTLSNHASPYIQSPSNHPSPYVSSSNPSPTPYARFPGLQQQYPQPHQHQYAYAQGPSQQPGASFSAPAPAFTDFAEQQAQAQAQLQAQAQMLEYTLPLSARAFPSAPAYFSPHAPPRPLSRAHAPFGTPSPLLLTATTAPFAPPDSDLQTMQMQYDALRRPSR